MAAAIEIFRRGRLGYAISGGGTVARLFVGLHAATRRRQRVVQLRVDPSLSIDAKVMDKDAWLEWAQANLSPVHAERMRRAHAATSAPDC